MHRVTQILTKGIQQLQENPEIITVVGIPRETYDIIISGLTGHKGGTKTADDLKIIQEKFNNLPETSAQLDGYKVIFQTLRLHAQHTANKLWLPEGIALTPELQSLAANYLPQQVLDATVATSLPEENISNRLLQINIADEMLHHDVAADKNLNKSVKEKVQRAATNSNVSLSEHVVGSVANKAVIAVNSLKPSGLATIASLGFSIAAALSSLGGGPSEQEEVETAEQSESDRQEMNPLGQALGFGLGLGVLTRKPEEKEAPVTIPSPPASGFSLGSVFSKVTSLFSKSGAMNKVITGAVGLFTGGVGFVATGVRLAASWLFSKFLGIFGGGSQGDHAAVFGLPEKKSIIFILSGIGIVLFIIFLLPLFITNMINSAMVDNLSQTPTTVVNTPTPIITTYSTPTPFISLIPSPTPILESSIVPIGFPVESSCVTQPPGGGYSHGNLNGVDIGRIADNSAWIIKATHPGTVIWAGNFGTYGLAVVLESLDKKFITYYGHMRGGSLFVYLGKKVERGDKLGIVDNTGYSSGNHLHYEIRGPRSVFAPWGSKTGPFGTIGTIYNFLPPCSTWTCQFYCNL